MTTIRLVDPKAATYRVKEIFEAVLRRRLVLGATSVSKRTCSNGGLWPGAVIPASGTVACAANARFQPPLEVGATQERDAVSDRLQTLVGK